MDNTLYIASVALPAILWLALEYLPVKSAARPYAVLVLAALLVLAAKFLLGLDDTALGWLFGAVVATSNLDGLIRTTPGVKNLKKDAS